MIRNSHSTKRLNCSPSTSTRIFSLSLWQKHARVCVIYIWYSLTKRRRIIKGISPSRAPFRRLPQLPLIFQLKLCHIAIWVVLWYVDDKANEYAGSFPCRRLSHRRRSLIYWSLIYPAPSNSIHLCFVWGTTLIYVVYVCGVYSNLIVGTNLTRGKIIRFSMGFDGKGNRYESLCMCVCILCEKIRWFGVEFQLKVIASICKTCKG